MEVKDPVRVRNPHGVVYWVARARLPELLRQGYEVVSGTKSAKAKAGAQRKQRRRERKEVNAKDAKGTKEVR